METKTKIEYKAIPRFNDHGAGCKGHANWMLDCEFTSQDDRDILLKALDNAILSNEKDMEAEKDKQIFASLKKK